MAYLNTSYREDARSQAAGRELVKEEIKRPFLLVMSAGDALLTRKNCSRTVIRRKKRGDKDDFS